MASGIRAQPMKATKPIMALLLVPLASLLGMIGACSTNRETNCWQPMNREYYMGQLAATDAISSGKLAFYYRGNIIRPGNNRYETFLKNEYGIDSIRDPSVAPEFISGYNEIMESEVRRRFGENFRKDVLDIIEPGVWR